MANAPKPASNKAAAPANETKADKFKRLGNARLGKVLEAMSSVAKLADHRSYEWSTEQRNKMIAALEAKVNEIKTALDTPKTEKKAATAAVNIL